MFEKIKTFFKKVVSKVVVSAVVTPVVAVCKHVGRAFKNALSEYFGYIMARAAAIRHYVNDQSRPMWKRVLVTLVNIFCIYTAVASMVPWLIVFFILHLIFDLLEPVHSYA